MQSCVVRSSRGDKRRMKVLVTGGAGFIGSHICERLLAEDNEVVCLDNFDPYYDPNLKHENIKSLLDNDGFRLVDGDILNYKLVRRIVRKDIDYVFHYAAQAGVRASIKDPCKANETNVIGTLNVLLACLNSQVKRIINASSSSVYGRVTPLPFTEIHPTMPMSPYGVSKLAAEHYCRVFSEVWGLKITSLRLFTVYGARMRPDLAISIFTQKALNGRTIEIFGNGNKTRDFTHVSDIVDANMLAIKRKNSGVYNIGGGHRISIRQLVNAIVKITKSNSSIRYTHSQEGDAFDTEADTEKAARELGYSPKVTIEQGIKGYCEYVVNNNSR